MSRKSRRNRASPERQGPQVNKARQASRTRRRGILIGIVVAVLLAVVARRQFMGVFPVVRLLQLFCAGYVVLLVYEVWMFVTYF